VDELAERRLYSVAAGPDPGPNFAADWVASLWPTDAPEQLGVAFRCSQITALWTNPPEPMVRPHRLIGQVYGTQHGGTDTDLFPTTAAVVRRVRVIRHLVQERTGRSAAWKAGARMTKYCRSALAC